MVDSYWRKIESVENNTENSIQISSILLKLKGYDEKLSNLSKIGNNENNISNNLVKINTNKNDINDIIEAQDVINLNSSSNASTILQNSSKINNNKLNIDEIKSNLNNIDSNINNKYSIENFCIYNIGIENSYKIDKDKPSFSIFKYTLEDNF